MDGFEKFADTYNKYNVIQKKIITKYLSGIENRVVDLGCGSEGLCKYKKFDFYLGIDSSERMLNLNPCNTVKMDFNTKECFEYIKKYDFEQIVSFSALQWADDLEFVFREIKSLNKKFLLAVFTSNTFKNLHNYLGVKSPIFSKEEIIKYSKILNPDKTEILRFRKDFTNPKELLEYIKFSGVKGGVCVNLIQLKKYYKYFPVKYLEFEAAVFYS